MSRRILPLVAIASFVACAPPGPRATALPAPLVTALMGDGPRGQLQFTVDSLPSEFPTQFRPAGGVRIVGGMKRGNQVVGIFSDSSRPLVPEFERLFERAGFRRPIERRPSGFSSFSGGAGNFCSDSGTAFIAPTADRHTVSVSYQRIRGFSCRDEAVGPDLEIPELKPPPGVRVPRAGGGSGGSGVDARAEMTGVDLKPGPILDHYATQLIAAGWKGDAPAVSDRVAAQFFEARSPAGQAWEGTMIVVGSGTSLSLSINMHPRTR